MSDSFLNFAKEKLYPLLKIEYRTPNIPLGHENDKFLTIIRADESYWKYNKFIWLIYVLVWTLAVAVGCVVALLTMPIILWHAIHIVIFVAVKSFIAFVVMLLTYELRWYIITDTSITIRQGAITVREITVSYQNIQNVNVTQGPLERYFGFSNLRVDTAGYGGANVKGQHHNPNEAVLRGIVNAEEIRDTILRNLRAFNNSGLGDPDDHLAVGSNTEQAESTNDTAGVVAAQREKIRLLSAILEEVKGC